MNESKQSLTTKMEELFLSILRNVILFVLAGSILAAIFFAISGISDLGAKPKEYQYEKFDSKKLVNDLKESLQAQPEAKPEAKPEATKKQSPQVGNPFEDEIAKQANFVVEFYKKYDFGVNPAWLNEQFKPRLRKQARNYSVVYGDGDPALLEYAKGQTQVFELVLLNPELNQLLDKKFKAQENVGGDERYQVIHDFANYSRRRATCHGGQVTTGLGVACTHQNATFNCLQRKDMTWLHQITGLGIFSNRYLDSTGAVGS